MKVVRALQDPSHRPPGAGKLGTPHGPGPDSAKAGGDSGLAGANYVGRVLARTYRLDRLLVTGGIGSVFLARHLRTGGPCAVKVLHRESAQNQELYRRFLDEARVTVALRHPHIVQVVDLKSPDDDTRIGSLRCHCNCP